MKMIEEFNENTPVNIFLIPDTPGSQTVQMYLKERGIPHSTLALIDMQILEPWFLELSPKAISPILKFNNEDVIAETLKIMSFLEQKVPVDIYPMMIPCTTSTKVHQKYIFYASLLDQINFDAIALGVDAKESEPLKDLCTKKLKTMETFAG